MCRSQQVNEKTEMKGRTEEECKLILTFDFCEEFEIMSIEQNNNQFGKDKQIYRKKIGKNSRVWNYRKKLKMRKMIFVETQLQRK